MNRRRTLIACGATLLSNRIGAASPSTAPLVLGQVSLSFYSVTGEVVAAVLSRLGHRVEHVEGTHEHIFPRLDSGTIDLMAAVWLPDGHAAYWKRFGTGAMEVTTLYEGARFFWGVPDYVPAEVASISDLATPQIARQMTRQIQGIGPGAAISVLSQRAITDYGLRARGYSFQPGTQAQWLAALRAARVQRRWILVPMWTPSFLIREGLRPLQDPLGVLGLENRAVLVGPRGRVEALPMLTRQTLSRMKLDLAAVIQMDWDVNVTGMTAKAAALAWIDEHEAHVDTWFV